MTNPKEYPTTTTSSTSSASEASTTTTTTNDHCCTVMDDDIATPTSSSSSSSSSSSVASSIVGTKRRTIALPSNHNHNINNNNSGSGSSNNSTSIPTLSSLSTTAAATTTTTASAVDTTSTTPSRSQEAMKQLFCGGLAGSIAKTVTAPFSRLTILFQVHSMVTTKNHRPQFANNMYHGMRKIIERGGIFSLWRGNMTSVLHRFPYSAINFYVYENTLDILSSTTTTSSTSILSIRQPDEPHETSHQLVRRLSKMVFVNDPSSHVDENNNHDDHNDHASMNNTPTSTFHHSTSNTSNTNACSSSSSSSNNNGNSSTSALHKFIAGAVAGVSAVTICYPLDLVRTRLSTELEGFEHYRGITDAFIKIYRTEGYMGFYSGIAPTLLVAVPNFAISYTTYGTLKEYMIDDDLFYNLRRIDTESGEKSKLGFVLTVACGAASGIIATLVTFPMDTIRRRMQVQNLHVPIELRMTSVYQQLYHMIHHEGLLSLYRGLTPELIKVVPMVGTMFFVYERTKEFLNVHPERNYR